MKWILFLLFTVNALAATTTHKTDKLKLGRDTGEDIYIFADTGAVNLPYLFYDFSESVWKQSNDGVTSEVVGGASVITTEGDLILGNASGEDARLGIGTNGQVLTSDGTTASWVTPSPNSPTTTLGDIIVRGAAVDERLPIGTQDQILTVELGTATWKDAPVSTTVSVKGDLQTHDGTSNSSLGVGADGEFLIADSNEVNGLKWSNQLQGILNPVTNFTSYTPVFSNMGNVVIDHFEWKQIGDEIRIRGEITLGTVPVSVGAASFTLPSGVDTSTSYNGVGDWRQSGDSTYAQKSGSFIISSGEAILVDDQSTTASSGTAFSQPFSNIILTSSASLTIDMTFKVVGWTSGTDAVARNKRVDRVKDVVSGLSVTSNVDMAIFPSPEVNTNNFATSTTTFSPSETGYYKITGFFREDAGIAGTLGVYENTVSYENLYISSNTNTFDSFSRTILLTEGNNYTIRWNATFTLDTMQIEINRDIDEFVLAGIFGKCQRKYLTANITTDTVDITDLRMNNLSVSSEYTIEMKAAYTFANVAKDSIAFFAKSSGANVCMINNSGDNNDVNSQYIKCKFTAAASTLTFDVSSIAAGNTFKGDGTLINTYVELCTDNKSNTTEF